MVRQNANDTTCVRPLYGGSHFPDQAVHCLPLGLRKATGWQLLRLGPSGLDAVLDEVRTSEISLNARDYLFVPLE
ncbi:hypothetical protein T4E_3328 [Trichinella pseudospiralis]|uniref:Uncharacterized protein n=1 Tax=Trichinella pseudospiralis TaxID=6337 RepID=A0A0V0YLF7_TRIPS|nr:hypothetical protein T4E_3328 [Trichinella pseudospiralis]